MGNSPPTTSAGVTMPSNTSTESSPLSPPQTVPNLLPSATPSHPEHVSISPAPNPEVTRSDTTTGNSGNETITSDETTAQAIPDPYSLTQYKRSNLNKKALRAEYPKGKPRELKKYYTRQNELIDAYLGSTEEEAAQDLDMGLYPQSAFPQLDSSTVD